MDSQKMSQFGRRLNTNNMRENDKTSYHSKKSHAVHLVVSKNGNRKDVTIHHYQEQGVIKNMQTVLAQDSSSS